MLKRTVRKTLAWIHNALQVMELSQDTARLMGAQ